MHQSNIILDFDELETQLDDGGDILVTYKYPARVPDAETDVVYHTRTDRLLAVEPSNGRVFVNFDGQYPVWIEPHEILMVEP